MKHEFPNYLKSGSFIEQLSFKYFLNIAFVKDLHRNRQETMAATGVNRLSG